MAERFDDAAVARMRSAGHVTELESCDEAALMEAVVDCDALLVRTASQVTRAVIDRASRLRVIGRGGVGLDHIDLEAARQRGIAVVHTPAAATDAVADLTLGLMIGLVRKIGLGDGMLRDGRFVEARRRCVGPELRELTVGIVGLGRIGKAVARRCRHGFGMTVLYNDIVDPGLLDFVASPREKSRLYEESDVVSLHVPLTEQTRRLIDEGALARFKQGSILINTARGAVVDGLAVAVSLASGRLGGAALDVFDPEPLPADHPLLTAPNAILTPHLGARSHGGLTRMSDVVDDVLAVLAGETPRFAAW